MVGTAAVGAAVCALYMNCTVPTGDCTFMFGKLGDDGMFVPLSSLPQLNNDTHQLNSGRRATSGSSLFLPSANKGAGCCNPNVLSTISLDSGVEQQVKLLPPPEAKSACGAQGCGLFQVAYDSANSSFPLVAWLQSNAPPPPPGLESLRSAAPETDPVVRLDPTTGKSVFVRTLTTMPAGHLAPKGQGLGAYDPETQTLYFPGSAGDLVDDRVFGISVRDGANDAPTMSTGPPKLDINGMEFSAALDGGKGAPVVLGTSISGFGPMPTALYQVVPQVPLSLSPLARSPSGSLSLSLSLSHPLSRLSRSRRSMFPGKRSLTSTGPIGTTWATPPSRLTAGTSTRSL